MSESKPITACRDASMIEGWLEEIKRAQEITTCVVNGKEVPRVRYGNEEEDWGADTRPCHDCAAIKGELHIEGCDVERCAGCGGQRFNCDCEPGEDTED